MFDPISQFLTSYKLSLKFLAGAVIFSVLTITTLSIHGCIDNKHIIAEQTRHIEIQNNIFENKEHNIAQAKKDNQIIEVKKIEVKEKLLDALIDFDKKINCNFKNFNKIDYVC